MIISKKTSRNNAQLWYSGRNFSVICIVLIRLQATAWGKVVVMGAGGGYATTKPVGTLPIPQPEFFWGKNVVFVSFFWVQKYVYHHQTPRKFSTLPQTTLPRKL